MVKFMCTLHMEIKAKITSVAMMGGLQILICVFSCHLLKIGINPGLMAAYIGRWFPGPGNHFCKFYVF